MGTFLINKFFYKIPNKIRYIVRILDFLSHICPLIYILFFMKRKKLKKYIYNLKIFIILFIIGNFYIKLVNPAKKVYFITNYSNDKLFFYFFILFLFIFYQLN